MSGLGCRRLGLAIGAGVGVGRQAKGQSRRQNQELELETEGKDQKQGKEAGVRSQISLQGPVWQPGKAQLFRQLPMPLFRFK